MKLEKVQFITHSNSNIDYFQSAVLALKGGLRFIQLRMKDSNREELISTGKRIKEECDKYNSLFILDDHVELVNEIGANGVHLGKEDMPIKEARKILGKDKIIGGTANNFEDIVKHYNDGADYIGLGPLRYTNTKKKLSPVLGFEGYRNIVEKCKTQGIDIPIYAIGGIRIEDIEELKRIGVFGIAISSLILESEDSETTINEINKIIK
ncbi:MAG: thiamine phosphate synthase [Bacteroidales bacterium]|jgi:thiamine-phosphate pyrophosphorylase|nr:thiamine phosphate synthase [Bacteroidales bacterium]